MKGTVKWFDSSKGYGFISAEDGNDYFVHYTGIASSGYRSLEHDQTVEFTLNEDPKGKQQAVNVTVI